MNINRQHTIWFSLMLMLALMFNVQYAYAQHVGKASYYSMKAKGAKMSNGERYHPDSMTCAHKTYPMGSLLKVVNLSNGKEVVVRVTDRGPHTRGRIIDLSYAAAKQIDMLRQGIVKVEVSEYLPEKGIPFILDPEEFPTLDLTDPEEEWIQRNNVLPDSLKKKK